MTLPRFGIKYNEPCSLRTSHPFLIVREFTVIIQDLQLIFVTYNWEDMLNLSLMTKHGIWERFNMIGGEHVEPLDSSYLSNARPRQIQPDRTGF